LVGNKAPIEVVKAVYEANPDAVSTKDWQGMTPVEACVDPETKKYLEQVVADRSNVASTDNAAVAAVQSGRIGTDEGDINVITTNRIDDSDGCTAGRAVNTRIEIQKLVAHVDNLSDQIVRIAVTAESMKQELERLRETLRKLH
jgi:hypothetical protein